MPHNDGRIEHITRTEQDVLKDFEALGYKLEINSKYHTIQLSKQIIKIRIFKNARSYEKYFNDDDTNNHISVLTTITEHKLLNELFKIWGWLE